MIYDIFQNNNSYYILYSNFKYLHSITPTFHFEFSSASHRSTKYLLTLKFNQNKNG